MARMKGERQISRRWAVAAGVALLLAIISPGSASLAEDLPAVRVGVLKFGTVNWELEVMRRHQLDRAHGFELKPLELAGKDGAAVALQGGVVDVILTDWFWVARRRATGGDFTFVPHSHATGGLMVRKDSGVASLADLRGRKIGIAGGPVDKSWLLLRAYARKTAGLDLARDAEPVFAAPPLLNETLKKGEIAAAVNFWQYNARLPQESFVELVRVEDMLPALGIPAEAPLLGWVFSDHWAAANPAVVQGFLAAAQEARRLLATANEEWAQIKPLTQVDDEAVLVRLREAYRRGVAKEGSGADEAAAAQSMLDLLIELGGIEEAPPGGRVPPGTFFAGGKS